MSVLVQMAGKKKKKQQGDHHILEVFLSHKGTFYFCILSYRQSPFKKGVYSKRKEFTPQEQILSF